MAPPARDHCRAEYYPEDLGVEMIFGEHRGHPCIESTPNAGMQLLDPCGSEAENGSAIICRVLFSTEVCAFMSVFCQPLPFAHS